MVDTKAARVKRLETQLKDIAYVTRPYCVDTSRFECGGDVEDGGELGDSVKLERGQDLLQFHISLVRAYLVWMSDSRSSHIRTPWDRP